MWPSSPQHLLLSSKCLIWTSSLNPLTLAVLLPEAAISGLLWASFRWRFKRKKKKCATAGKRGLAEWFKGHSCQRVLVQTPGTFYIICRSYRTSSQMSCTTKKSSPYTIDPNNKNVITIKFVTGPHGSLANPFIVILNFSTKKKQKNISIQLDFTLDFSLFVAIYHPQCSSIPTTENQLKISRMSSNLPGFVPSLNL